MIMGKDESKLNLDKHDATLYIYIYIKAYGCEGTLEGEFIWPLFYLEHSKLLRILVNYGDAVLGGQVNLDLSGKVFVMWGTWMS